MKGPFKIKKLMMLY